MWRLTMRLFIVSVESDQTWSKNKTLIILGSVLKGYFITKKIDIVLNRVELKRVFLAAYIYRLKK